MKSQRIVLAALATSMAVVSVVRAETVSTRIGNLEFQGSYPSNATITKLYDERDFQRATQAYLWALPIVGMANESASMTAKAGTARRVNSNDLFSNCDHLLETTKM